MANAIEILYFVQQKSPTYIQSMEEELDIKGKSGCSILPVSPEQLRSANPQSQVVVSALEMLH